MEILHQLGQLFLKSVPTIIIVLLFYAFMRWAFFGPIQNAMAERTARIEGARAEAAQAEASAREELDSYNESLRKARAEIYAQQEKDRRAALDDRAKLMKSARMRAQEEVDAGKKKIAAEVAAARRQMDQEIPALAAQIARKILEISAPLPGGPAR